MKTINPYLNFSGNTEEAFNFYKSVFGGEFTALMRFKDLPETEKVSEADAEKIMHISLPIGNGTVLMATDALESMGQKLLPGNNFYLAIETESKKESDDLFARLSAGGKIEMPMQEMFWGDYFGSFSDKFGVQWMIAYTMEKTG